VASNNCGKYFLWMNTKMYNNKLRY
jgi:hypothetical protein